MTSQRKDDTWGIQPMFVYEPMEDWEVEQNANIDVDKETEENYL